MKVAVWVLAFLAALATAGACAAQQASAYLSVAPLPPARGFVTRMNIGLRHTLDNFRRNTSAEFAFCVRGKVVGRSIQITELVLTPQYGNVKGGITWAPCTGFIGRLHTHPWTCNFSPTDKETAAAQGYWIDLIWCAPDRGRVRTLYGDEDEIY